MAALAHDDAPEPERQFLQHLPVIDRILAIIGRRHALAPADAEEFAAWARSRLVDGEYAVFRKFSGRSAMATYLTTVLTNLFHDWRNAEWGRWRPSAMAKRLGPTAVALEQLVRRDGVPLREAIATLRARGVREDDVALARMAALLPDRAGSEVSLHDVEEEAARALPVAPVADPDGTRAALEAALRGVVDALPPEDALIVRMHFWNDRTVAEIARALGIDQKRLYRRIEAVERRLRAALEAHGFDRERVRDAIGETLSW